LIDATIRTEAGVKFSTDGEQMPWGNAVIGTRNPVAPPLVIERAEDGSMFADVHLGAAYEGPPGHVTGEWRHCFSPTFSARSPAPSRVRG
jgi:hypothetical protein